MLGQISRFSVVALPVPRRLIALNTFWTARFAWIFCYVNKKSSQYRIRCLLHRLLDSFHSLVSTLVKKCFILTKMGIPLRDNDFKRSWGHYKIVKKWSMKTDEGLMSKFVTLTVFFTWIRAHFLFSAYFGGTLYDVDSPGAKLDRTKKLQTLLFHLIVSEDKLLFAQLIEVRFHFKTLLQCFIKKVWAKVETKLYKIS